jgi:hypothetical protein
MITLTKFPGEGVEFSNGLKGFLIVTFNRPTPGFFLL